MDSPDQRAWAAAHNLLKDIMVARSDVAVGMARRHADSAGYHAYLAAKAARAYLWFRDHVRMP